MSSKIYRVVGPPGTGKTTYVARQCQNAATRYGPSGVLVASLTRAAAAEASGRDTGLAPGSIGTLHSHCFHALGRPRVVDTALIREWNERAKATGEGLTAADVSLDKGEALGPGKDSSLLGDRRLAHADVLRARMTPIEMWPEGVRGFYRTWCAFKDEVSALDFTDLIERALTDLPDHAPGRPGAIFIDEAQDLSALELALVERWSSRAETTVIVGDPYQALYGWRGSSPTILTSGEVHKVLDQSHRVPRLVQRAALSVIARCEDWRQDLAYHPTHEPGAVQASPASWRSPLHLVEEWITTHDGTLMILASCDYQLAPVKQALIAAGIRYHNPYTWRWNPVSEHALKRVATMLKLSTDDPLHDLWTVEELRDILPLFYRATSTESERGLLLRNAPELRDEMTWPEIADYTRRWLAAPGVAALIAGNLSWVCDNLLAAASKSLDAALRIVDRQGLRALLEKPRVILGTVHSVKGGEADHVALFPDLSPNGMRAWLTEGWGHRDAVRRMMYVGATRARQSLTICAPAVRKMAPIRMTEEGA